jgi:CDP-glycerol glycerophosphotransferase (TagB/SpsB family)
MGEQADNGIYYFLGNITSHILHALPLHKELGGTFVVLSKRAKREVEKYGVPVIAIDNKPYRWQRFGWRIKPVYHYLKIDESLHKTSQFLNKRARVVIFYELYDFSKPVRLTKPKTIFLTHGNMLKDYMANNSRLLTLNQYNYMASLGPRLKKIFTECDGIDQSKLIDVGVARTDSLVKHKGTIWINPDLSTEIGIRPDKKLVAYMPTFWGQSSIYDSGLHLIKNFPERYTLIFRPHPQTPRSLLRKYQHIIRSKPNVIYAPEGLYQAATLENLFAASSVIVGDISSVMLEAILVNKPLIFMELGTGSLPTAYDAIKEVVEFSQKIGLDTNDVGSVIDHSIERGVDGALWLQCQRNNFFNFDGDSTKAIAGFIRKSIL